MRSTPAFVPTIVLALSCAVAVSALTARADEEDDSGKNGLFRHYGFSGLVISKLNDGCSCLTAGDVDGDGKDDLVVVNNARARINLFLNRGEPGAGVWSEGEPESVNDLPDEAFFARENYPVEEKVTSIAIADLNGDKTGDLLYLGDSNKVSVAWREKDGRYRRVVRFAVEQPSPVSEALRAADLNGDGKTDFVVLGKENTYLFLQGDGDKFLEKITLANATKDVGGFAVVDLNGDRALDLLYATGSGEWPFRHRLGLGAARFGPEVGSRFAEIRNYCAADVDGDGSCDVLAIRKLSGRLSLLRLTDQPPADADKLELSALRAIAYAPSKDADKRDETLADLDGDGQPELIVSEPSAARIVVHRDLLGGARCASDAYPAFVGAARPRAADLDGDGRVEIVMAAVDEGAIGVAKVDEHGKLAFPASIPIPEGKKLLALDAADTDGDKHAEIWLAVADKEKKGGKVGRQLVQLGKDGAVARSFDLPECKSDPTDLWLVDLDRDGKQDAILFLGREVPKVLLARGDKFEDAKADQVPNLGILNGLARRQLAYGDIDGDGKNELLAPGPNFARAFWLSVENGKVVPQVVGQFNLDSPTAEVTAVGFADLDGEPGAEIVVVDKPSDSARVLKRGDGAAREIAKVDLPIPAASGILVGDLDKNGRQDLLFTTPSVVGAVQNGGRDPTLVVVADFEAPVKEAYLDAIEVGDLNSDGEPDIAIAEVNHHLIEVVAAHKNGLEHALKWPVYEQRIFERGERGDHEPREIVIRDVTGDGRADIAILVHDRLIVYPQEKSE